MSERRPAKSSLGIERHEDGSIKLDGKSLLASLGGVLGVVESAVPGLAYVALFAFTRDTALSLLTSSALAIGFIAAQFARRRPLAQALYGLVGVFITMFLTLRNGNDPEQARDYFLTGFFTNAAYLAAIVISIVVRWPVVGILVGVLTNGVKWRQSRRLVRRYSLISCIWVGLFSVRLLVEVPFYIANNVVVLGFLKLVMGVPLYALCAWLTWLAVKPLIRRAE